jgi:hypothetical protein
MNVDGEVEKGREVRTCADADDERWAAGRVSSQLRWPPDTQYYLP